MHNEQSQMVKGFQLHQAGKLKKAAQCYKAVLKSNPRHPDALMLLGIVQYENNDIIHAARTLEKAVTITPDRAATHYNFGLALQAQGKRAKAAEAFKRALHIDPAFKDAQCCLGIMLVQIGEHQAGRAHLEDLRSTMADNPELFGWFGTAMQRLGDNYAASQAFYRALELDPENLVALLGLGSLPNPLIPSKVAYECAKKAAMIAPKDANALGLYSRWLVMRSHLDDARIYAQRAIKAEAHNFIAQLSMIRIELAQGDPQNSLERAQNLLTNRTDLPFDVKRDVYGLIGTALDKLGDYDKAFAAFEMKNNCIQSLPETQKLDPSHIPKVFERTRSWLADGGAQVLKKHQAQPLTVPCPIFFIGFPRSGTTLMEQVLGSHPLLQTSGELPALELTLEDMKHIVKRDIDYPKGLATLSSHELDTLRDVYWSHFKNALNASPSDRTLVDKNPYNTFYLPLVRALFPTAKVIMALRDPRDVCLSNLMQTFVVSKPTLQMKDMTSTARFYVEFMELWQEEREKLGLDWHEYRYEDLVDNFDGTVARVLDFLKLPWDDAVRNYRQTAKDSIISTPSYSDVVNKISNKAIGRWKNYEAQMQDALEILKADIVKLGYMND